MLFVQQPTCVPPAGGFLLLALFAVTSGGLGPRPGGFNRGEADSAEVYLIFTFHDYTPPPPLALPPAPAPAPGTSAA